MTDGDMWEGKEYPAGGYAALSRVRRLTTHLRTGECCFSCGKSAFSGPYIPVRRIPGMLIGAFADRRTRFFCALMTVQLGQKTAELSISENNLRT